MLFLYVAGFAALVCLIAVLRDVDIAAGVDRWAERQRAKKLAQDGEAARKAWRAGWGLDK